MKPNTRTARMATIRIIAPRSERRSVRARGLYAGMQVMRHLVGGPRRRRGLPGGRRELTNAALIVPGRAPLDRRLKTFSGSRRPEASVDQEGPRGASARGRTA